MANNFTSSLLNVEIGKTLTRREFSQYSDVFAAVNVCCLSALSTKHCWYNSFRLKDFRNFQQEVFLQLKPENILSCWKLPWLIYSASLTKQQHLLMFLSGKVLQRKIYSYQRTL